MTGYRQLLNGLLLRIELPLNKESGSPQARRYCFESNVRFETHSRALFPPYKLTYLGLPDSNITFQYKKLLDATNQMCIETDITCDFCGSSWTDIVLCGEHKLECVEKEKGDSHRKCSKLKRVVEVADCFDKSHDCLALYVGSTIQEILHMAD